MALFCYTEKVVMTLPKAKDGKVEKAFALYKQGMKLSEIAKKLDKPEGTIRRWKCTDKWDSERSEKKPSKANKPNKKKPSEANVKKNIEQVTIEPIAEEVKSVMENSELTDKQRLFCLYFIKSFNATKSYMKAYGCKEYVAAVSGCQLLKNPKIKAEIEHLKQVKLNRAYLSEADIVQKYMDIAFADYGDYMSWGGVEAIAQPSNKVDGTIVTEVSQGKDGVTIKLADRMKALQWLSDHMDMATKEQQARIALIKAKTAVDEHEDITQDDGFIDALKGSAKEDWEDAEKD